MKLRHLDVDKAGMKVPQGGSSCAKCMFYVRDGSSAFGKCKNEGFISWQRDMKVEHAPDEIPAPPDEYCSNWYDWDDGGNSAE